MKPRDPALATVLGVLIDVPLKVSVGHIVKPLLRHGSTVSAIPAVWTMTNSDLKMRSTTTSTGTFRGNRRGWGALKFTLP
ncbi:MAG: hypothetical protein ACREYF_13895 [Gammaproteobacteria bacterium]